MKVLIRSFVALCCLFLVTSSESAFGQATCDADGSVIEVTYWNYSGVDPGVSVTLCDSTSVPVTVSGSGSGPYTYTAPVGKSIISTTISNLTITAPSTGTGTYNYGGSTYGSSWSVSGYRAMTINLY